MGSHGHVDAAVMTGILAKVGIGQRMCRPREMPRQLGRRHAGKECLMMGQLLHLPALLRLPALLLCPFLLKHPQCLAILRQLGQRLLVLSPCRKWQRGSRASRAKQAWERCVEATLQVYVRVIFVLRAPEPRCN